MAQLGQKQAVLKYIDEVLAEDGQEREEGAIMREVLTSDQKKRVAEKLHKGFVNGEIALNKEKDDKSSKTYAGSVLNNWLRKAKELNGGSKYTPKNPGSRAGQGDDMLRELKKLYASLKEANASQDRIQRVQEAIDARQAEIKAAKPKMTVDWSKIPDSVKEALGEAANA